jgi:hypothetical protein
MDAACRRTHMDVRSPTSGRRARTCSAEGAEGADPGWPSFGLPFLGHARKGDSRVSAKAFDVARRRRTRSVLVVDFRDERRKTKDENHQQRSKLRSATATNKSPSPCPLPRIARERGTARASRRNAAPTTEKKSRRAPLLHCR